MARKIRVLEVVRPAAGGMKKHVQGLIQGLDRGRFEVFLAAPKDEAFGQWATLEGVGYVPIEISHRMLTPSDVIACLKLRSLIRAIQPDICHFHGFKAAAVGRVAVAAMNGPQVVYTVHNSVLSRSNAHFLPASSSTAARSSSSHPAGRRSFALKGRFHFSKLQRKMCLYTEHALAEFTHRVIAVSKDIYQEYSAIPSLGQEKTRYIPNGIDLKRFCMTTPFESRRCEDAKKDLGCETEIPVVGLVSRLIPDKGVKTFLLAVASLRRMGLTPQVLIAGDGPSRSELEALAKELGLFGQVRFLGFIDDMVSFYAALDVFVLSSFSEGTPLALIEAMAVGVPVVATRTGGVEEIVAARGGGAEEADTPDAGRLVAPGDADAMAACIRDTILYPEKSRILADKAKLYVKENFSLEEMVRKTEEVYEEVLAYPGPKELQH